MVYKNKSFSRYNVFNDVLFVSRNTANLVERSTVNTNDILVLGEKIDDSLIVSE